MVVFVVVVNEMLCLLVCVMNEVLRIIDEFLCKYGSVV